MTSTVYAVNDCVHQGGSGYVCIVAHTAGTFATDLAAAKWSLLVEQGPQGATGSGAQGPQGATGAQGAQGAGTVILTDYMVSVQGTQSTTLVDIPDLSLSLEANSRYAIDGLLDVSNSASTTGAQFGIQASVAPQSVVFSTIGPQAVVAGLLYTDTSINHAGRRYFIVSAERNPLFFKAYIWTANSATTLNLRYQKITSGQINVNGGSWINAIKL